MTEVALVDENWKPSSGDLNESKATSPPGGKNFSGFSGWFEVAGQFDKNFREGFRSFFFLNFSPVLDPNLTTAPTYFSNGW